MKFPKNFFKLLSLDVGFFVVITLLFVFFKAKINSYVFLFQDYSFVLASINPELNPVEAEQALQLVNSLANNALFLFILIPVILFIVYVAFQGGSFAFLQKKKNYLMKFSLITLPVYLLLVLAAFYGWPVWTWIFIFLLGYGMFLLYLQHDWKKVMKLFKKAYVTFPLYLGYAAFFFFIGLFLFYFYLQTIIELYPYWIFAVILILLLGLSWYRLWLVKKFG